MSRAIELARQGMEAGLGGPFGCVIVKDGVIIGEGNNQVTGTNDPTAHAEIVAIRNACKHLSAFQLTDCEVYATCELCPMCLGAIYWARPKAIYFACTREDAANIGFDDAHIYNEFSLPSDQRSILMRGFLREKALPLFENWQNLADKTPY